MNKNQNLSVSVIIPTHDRYDDLNRCLSHIHSSIQSFPYFELIVVDSSKDMDRIKDLVESFNGKYIHEPRKGVSIARNTGIENAKGDILVFADDDFIVDKSWITNLIENYKDENIVCCTGRMLSYRNDDVSNIYEKSMSFDRGNKKREFTKNDINIFNLFKTITKIGNKRLLDKTPVPWAIGFGFYSFRKEIFADIGKFDIGLGRGTPSIGGEDPDIFYRIIKSGKTIVYEPKAVIYHNHREIYNDILKDAYNAGVSIKALTTKYAKKKDMYMSLILIGEFFLLSFSYIKTLISRDKSSSLDFSQLIKEELKGLLEGKIYRQISK